MVPVRPARWATAAALLMAAGAAAQPPAGAPGMPADPKPADPKPAEPEWPKAIQGRSLEQWLEDFKTPDPTVKEFAVKTVPQFGPPAMKPALKPLLAVVRDPDPGVKVNAILALSNIRFETKADAQAAADAVRAAVGNTGAGSIVRLHGVRALVAFGADSKETLATVLSLTQDPSWETRQTVAEALGRLGAPVWDEKAAPDPSGRPPAPKRPANKTALDRLTAMLPKEPSGAVRAEIAQALVVIGPPYVADPTGYPKAVEPYLKAVTDRLKDERNGSARAWLLLAQLMYDDRSADANLSQLAALVGDPDPGVRVQALTALAILGPKAKPAVPAAVQALAAKEDLVLAGAVSLLVAVGGDAAKAAVRELERMVLVAGQAKDEGKKRYLEAAIDAIKAGRKAPEPPKKDDKKG